LPTAELPAHAAGLRAEIQVFLAEQRRTGGYVPDVNTWMGGLDPSFSAALGRRGWIGMTWPVKYGGGASSALDRFVVIEELLAAGAPIAAHWFADRQVGPALLRYGTEEQRCALLPAMAAGRCFFAIGMSEPDTGSDLASVRTRATRADGGWRVSGTKLWSSGAHICHFMMTLLRTSPGRHDGLSQMIIDLTSPGISIRPIGYLTGESHFNEVVLDDVFVPDSRVVGRVGAGWEQVNSELAYERSGPERFLSVMQLL
jgi:alkylation response protein AidB-like acyl-CoA dehydrogenase